MQNGKAGLQFGTGAPAKVAVQILNPAGVDVRDVTLDTAANGGAWTWDGTDNAGRQLTDGAYKVGVTDAAGGTAAVPFNVVGTATGLVQSGNQLQLQLGSVPVDFSSIKSVAN